MEAGQVRISALTESLDADVVGAGFEVVQRVWVRVEESPPAQRIARTAPVGFRPVARA